MTNRSALSGFLPLFIIVHLPFAICHLTEEYGSERKGKIPLANTIPLVPVRLGGECSLRCSRRGRLHGCDQSCRDKVCSLQWRHRQKVPAGDYGIWLRLPGFRQRRLVGPSRLELCAVVAVCGYLLHPAREDQIV